MALQEEYSEALNTCIDRLAAGETLEAILGDYPALANELRPMLAVGSLFKQARYPSAEVSAAQSRLAPKIQAASQSSLGMGAYWSLLIVVLVIGIGTFVWQGQSPTSSPSESSPETTATLALESTAEATENPPLITIEGEIQAINANIITIYNMEFGLAPNDPLLSVIQIGDVVRIEGESHDSILLVISIVFVNVDVVVQDGAVWRDNSNCDNPPPPWAVANGWRRRCEGGGGNGNGNANGNGNGNSNGRGNGGS